MRRIICQTVWTLCLLVSLTQIGTSQTGTASISGRVMRNGEPVGNVYITVQQANQIGWGRTNISAKTDANGEYHLTGLKAGSYSLNVRALADVTVIEGQPTESGKTVVLYGGEDVTGVDFSLIRGGVITGTITDENGKPAGREAITLLRHLTRGSNGQRVAYAPYHWELINLTDERGVYRLFGLPPGQYLVCIGGRSSVNGKSYPITYYPGTTDEQKAKVVEVSEGGEIIGIDIKRDQPETMFIASGRIVDAATGKPMAGVRICYGAINRSGDLSSGWRITSERTNEKGEFQLSGLRPGSHIACLAPEDAPGYYSELARFEITAAEVKGVELKAVRSGSVSGVVTFAGARLQTLLPDYTKLVVVYRNEPDTLQAPRTSLPRVNPDGSFRLTGIKPGNIRLHVNNTDFSAPRLFLLRVERNGVEVPDGLVAVRPGEEIAPIRLVVGVGTGVVRGQLTFTGGTLPAGEPVRVFLRKLKAGTVQDLRLTLADAAGRFGVDGLLPGEYQLDIQASGTLRLTPTIRKRLATPQFITVAAETETTVALTYDLSEEGK